MRIADRAIPSDSTVVVVGANGYMAVETCEKLLQAGYRVCGTVRDVERHRNWMHALFDENWPDRFELVQVQDFQDTDAFDNAFQGASGVIYPSMPMIFDADPVKVYEPMIKGVVNTLCKRQLPYELTNDMFNYEAIEKVQDGPVDASFERILAVYSAGRTLAELEFWKCVKANNPPFVANCVVPDGQFGRVIDTQNINLGARSSTRQLMHALQGQWDKIKLDIASVTDVQNSARLLVAAVALASIKNQRIFSYYINMTWNDMRRKIREMCPDRPELVTGDNRQKERRDTSHASKLIARAEDILRAVGQHGFVSEDDIICDFVTSVFT
ncbi:putative aldehyde reductase 2 [Truncatella angustata]|uniref:Aldehyde reductase 2 n=1 Tax=Truncatella angustata TaxID=152316 RepID=A0A9P8UFN0_9PEZI|nr:putative aldehyde reductase 2 [Truncatella angustata]KAH6649046.1 putative aldehyde reductase 2 [Truncatella angustata]